MAHPSMQFPDAVFLVDAVSQPVKPDGGVVYAITNIGPDVNVHVKSNVFEYIDVGGALTSYIDPTTGELGVASVGLVDASGNTTKAGYYELTSSQNKSIPILSGQTIYGKFSEAQLPGSETTGKLLMYTTRKNQVGL
jgi:hypothetical protein